MHDGADAPLFLAARTCAEIHGSSGLCVEGGSFVDIVRARLTESGREHLFVPACSRKGAVQAMAEAIERAASEIEEEEEREEEKGQQKQKVALVATGALTNIALLLWTRPDLVLEKKFDLYLMGGAVGTGNTGVVAEFNFEVDPHAAAAVFGAAGAGKGLKVTMAPLEVTHTALVSASVLEKLGLEGRSEEEGEAGGEEDEKNQRNSPLSPLRAALRSLLLYFADTYSKHFGFVVGPPLHDPLAVLAAILPPEEAEEGEGEEEGGGGGGQGRGQGEGEQQQGGRRQRPSPPVFSLTRARVDVETSSPLSLGQSVVDLTPELGRSKHLGEPNAWVATRVDLEALWGMLGGAMERADVASPL